MHKVIEDKDILFLTKRIFQNSFKYFVFPHNHLND